MTRKTYACCYTWAVKLHKFRTKFCLNEVAVKSIVKTVLLGSLLFKESLFLSRPIGSPWKRSITINNPNNDWATEVKLQKQKKKEKEKTKMKQDEKAIYTLPLVGLHLMVIFCKKCSVSNFLRPSYGKTNLSF